MRNKRKKNKQNEIKMMNEKNRMAWKMLVFTQINGLLNANNDRDDDVERGTNNNECEWREWRLADRRQPKYIITLRFVYELYSGI